MSWLGLEAEAAGLIWSDALDRFVHPDEFTNESLEGIGDIEKWLKLFAKCYVVVVCVGCRFNLLERGLVRRCSLLGC